MKSLTRRRFLLAGATASTLVVPGLVQAKSVLPMPRATEGPFYPDVMPQDRDNDLVRIAGHVKRAGGEILNVSGKVLDESGRPVPNAMVEIWQADVNGRYIHTGSAWSSGKPRDDDFQGYGKITAGPDGAYSFRTIRPVAYTGRCPHIHVKIHDPNGGSLTSQIYIAGDALNERDWIYRQMTDAGKQASSMTLERARSNETDWTSRFDIVVPWAA